jgi:MYXO-CTERM domain-containing protein
LIEEVTMSAIRKGAWVSVVAGGLTLALASPVQGQEQVKPYVMLLFDTSGSMLWDVCHSDYDCIEGDNSVECPGNQISCNHCNTYGCGNGIADDSRLYKVKKGAHNVVSAFGEVTFALSRFNQVPASFTCNTPSYGRAGGWVYGGCNSNSPAMGSGGNQADVLVGFADNNHAQILTWMNNCDDYPTAGACPQSLAPSSGCSLCADCGAGCDHEIRGTGNTPIAGSLYDLRVNYFPTVFAADTQKLACRPYKVILLTDGQNNCVGNPATEAGNLYNNAAKSIPVHVIGFGSNSLKPNLDSIASSGGTGKAIVVDNEVSLALAMASIISESILVEKCNGVDDDCDDLCDEDWPEVAVTGPTCTNQHAAQTCTAGLGICMNTGIYVCKADGSGAECNAVAGPPNPGGEICNNGLDDDCDGAIDEGCPPCPVEPEVCDGKDNDCDGTIDEGYVPVPCGSNIGECAQGMTACEGGKVVCNGQTPPTTELCDNLDNNCDTVVDAFYETCYPPGDGNGCDLATQVCQGNCQVGLRLCTNGSWGGCVGYQGPANEICNGMDDDCDGQIDEGVMNTCTDYTTCTTSTTCAVCPVAPPEVCDAADNDCDGQVDEDYPEKGKPCGSTVGECQPGTWICENGQLVCSGTKGPTPEECDGLDNDCNGIIDDNVPGEGDPCGESEGECEPGKKKCLGGQWVCLGAVGPTEEICDGKDNDCDGTIDEDAECPVPGSKCENGMCVIPCDGGEFSCPGGYTCVNGYCVPDPCLGVTCADTERCVNGTCVAKCTGVVCEDYEKCEPTTGQCVDDSCVTKGCAEGEKCVAHKCVADPCPPGKCPSGQMCQDGICYDLCGNVECPPGQSCIKGKCTGDPCAGYPCPSNHTCKVVDGKPQCVPDPCRVVNCPEGQVCLDGECIADPCATTTCPEGFHCKMTSLGEATCALNAGAGVPTTNQLLATGAGGCACRMASSPSPTPPWLLLAAGLLLLLRRRR